MRSLVLAQHHEDWFAYRCANDGVVKLTGVTLDDAAEVCTQINGTGFTEEVARIRLSAEAFQISIGRIASAVLAQADLDGHQPVRGSGRRAIVAGPKTLKCNNKLEATAILAADALERPIAELFGGALDGDNTWQTEKDAEQWVRDTFSAESPVYRAALQRSMEAAEGLCPTALFRLNAFLANPEVAYTIPTTVLTEICIHSGGAVVIESTDTPAVALATTAAPCNVAVGAEWPPMVRVRATEGETLKVSVV